MFIRLALREESSKNQSDGIVPQSSELINPCNPLWQVSIQRGIQSRPPFLT